MQHIHVIGIDADDTLWHNEVLFGQMYERFRLLLARYHDPATADESLLAMERRNLDLYGYGVKGFTLSAIETAIELTRGKISADELRTLIDLGREILAHPVELLDGVRDTVAELSKSHELYLITKGDLRDQKRKLVKSGLAPFFRQIEVVAEKDPSVYAEILHRHGVPPSEFLMVGNSTKSDILPVLQIGGYAAQVPYHMLWQLERCEETPHAPGRYFELTSFRDLIALLAPTPAAPASGKPDSATNG